MRLHPLPRLEARLLLGLASRQTATWLATHGDEPAAAPVASHFDALARRRLAGEPIAYLTGQREFRGRDFIVTPAVLIPRPDTERLVEVSLELLAAVPAPRILDLGTGSGVVAITLALERPDARILASDRSQAALTVARANAQALHAATVRFTEGDWWQAVAATEAPFDLIASNPPYVADADPHLAQGDLRFEPSIALRAGADGLDDIRRLIEGAGTRLAENGWLALEHGFDQGHPVRQLMTGAGLRAVATHRDLAGLPRVSAGQRGFQG